jgi:hypothetical protein
MISIASLGSFNATTTTSGGHDRFGNTHYGILPPTAMALPPDEQDRKEIVVILENLQYIPQDQGRTSPNHQLMGGLVTSRINYLHRRISQDLQLRLRPRRHLHMGAKNSRRTRRCMATTLRGIVVAAIEMGLEDPINEPLPPYSRT